MDKGLSRNNTKQVDQTFGFFANVSTNNFTTGRRVKDGEVNVRIGVSGVEKAAEADRVRCFPELENTEYVDEVVEEASVFVPTLACTDRAENGDKGREVVVDGLELATEEGTS